MFNNLNQLVSETVGGKMRVHGQTNEPSSVSVRSNSNSFVSAPTDSGNHFTAWVDVDPGVNTITVEAEDVSPNGNTRTNRYQIDVEGKWINTTYDLNGNTTDVGTNDTGTTGRVKRYDWDAENRLIKITYIDDSTTEFQYDGRSRRVGQVEKDGNGTPVQQKTLIWVGLTLSEEREGGIITRQYFPQGEKRGVNKYFYGLDHLRSVRDVTDETGTLWRRYDYDAYGRTRRVDHLQETSTNGGPRLIKAVSRMKHGSSEIPKDVELRLSQENGMGSEMREAGASDLILTFDQPIGNFTGLVVNGGSAGTASASGSSITIPITFTGDGEISVEFAEVASLGGETEGVVFKYRALKGDTNQDGLVDALDVAEWGYNVGDLDTVPMGSHADVNRDWQLDVSDKGLIEGSFTVGFATDEADFRYTGHYYHIKSGLYLAPYRAYNPLLGRWINRDPIEEEGGTNLYAYVDGGPIRKVDNLGLNGGYWDAFKEYYKGWKEVREANVIGADKYFHCLASCKAARKSSKKKADVLCRLREIGDNIKKGVTSGMDGEEMLEQAKDSFADMEANRDGLNAPKGQSCEQACSKYKVKGL